MIKRALSRQILTPSRYASFIDEDFSSPRWTGRNAFILILFLNSFVMLLISTTPFFVQFRLWQHSVTSIKNYFFAFQFTLSFLNGRIIEFHSILIVGVCLKFIATFSHLLLLDPLTYCVIILLGSHVTISGKIINRARRSMPRRKNGIMD